jgi:Tfp pilus assembly PilM family ATPase/Tfp pilus assembly protein PilN
MKMKFPGLKLPKFNSLLDIGKRDIIAIEFNASSVKVVYIKVSPNKKELLRVFYRDTNGLSDLEISRSIRSCINELQLKNPEVINVIPSQMVIPKNIEVPSINQKEIKEIINLQAGHHTPYSREEVTVDYIEIGVYKNSYTKILLIILARNVMKRHSDILEKAGLRMTRALFASEGISCFMFKTARLDNTEAPFCVVQVDAAFSDFTVVLKGKAIYIRSVPLGTQHFAEDREITRIRFVEEMRRSMEAYQSENIERPPVLCFLTGAIEEIRGIEQDLNNALRIPSRMSAYFSNINVPENVMKEVSQFKRISFLDPVSAVLSLDDVKVDLMPEEIKLRRNLEERGKGLIKTGIYVMALLVMLVIILVSKIYLKGAYLKNLDRTYQTLNQEASVLEKDFSEIGMIKEYLLNRGYSIDVLSELHSVSPLSVRLEDIRFDAQGKLALRGVAQTMSDVFNFVDSLEKSKLFKDVKTKYTSMRREGAKDVADFEISCSLER